MSLPVTDGLTVDYQVTAEGLLHERLSDTLAGITGNGGVLPNTRLWSTVQPGGFGWCADFTNAVAVRVPAMSWPKAAGTMVFVAAPNAAPNYQRLCEGGEFWPNNITMMVTPVGAHGGVQAVVNEGGVTVTPFVNVSAGAGGNVYALSWTQGAPARVYINGVAGAATGNTGSPFAMAGYLRIGSNYGGGGYYNAAIQRFLYYGRELSAAEHAELAVLANGIEIVDLGGHLSSMMAVGII